jgi:predicted HNH restriction endonuclease
VDEQISRTIRNIHSLADLAQFEENAEKRQTLNDEIREAIRERSAGLGRAIVAEKLGRDLNNLSPAEEKIVLAASEYAGIKKRLGRGAPRMFSQLRNRGLIGAAEVSVMRLKPTQGFETLADAKLANLSYEQIIVDYPEEFSTRALWYARRTLGLPNEGDRPPAPAASPTQERTNELLRWLEARSATNEGHVHSFTNADAAAALGITDMQRSGRVFGNIQSRIDFACYSLDLPPLGLTADKPFDMAWAQQDRNWTFPVEEMQIAARARIWSANDFKLIFEKSEQLPGQAHDSWKKELAVNEEKVRAWAFGLVQADPNRPAIGEPEARGKRNPAWSRDELILALDLYLRFRASPPSKDSDEVAELSRFLSQMAGTRGAVDAETFRNANGVYMKMMNFRRFDPEYTIDGKVGLARGNKLEEFVWNEFANSPAAIAEAVSAIRASVTASGPLAKGNNHEHIVDAPYWVFVCNPKKWAIDRFLDRNIEHDTWGVRSADRDRFAPGQLGIIRVGVDRRTENELNGSPPLEAGIYALCEVESKVFDGTGAGDEFWSDGEGREPGWPTVKIRYVRTYRHRPLTIVRLRAERPDVSHLLLNGFQASSFPIGASDFHAVMELLGEDVDELVVGSEVSDASSGAFAELQKKYINASPEVKERVSRYIERGSVGTWLKKELGFKCQVCDALGGKPTGFLKKNGEPYVEAHHVMPVSAGEVGSLAASNILVVCANHHRQLHYGGINVEISATHFIFAIEERPLKISRFQVGLDAQ